MTGLPPVLLAGIDGHGRLGDEAVIEALVRGLREKLPDLRLTVVAADEERTRRWLETQTVPCAEWAPIAAAVDASRVVVVACGRALTDLDGFDPEHVLADGSRGLAHTAGVVLLARAFGRPYVLASVALAAIETPAAQAAAGALASRAARVGAAGPDSAARLSALGADPARVDTAADLAFALRPCAATRVEEILAAARLAPGAEPLLAVVPPEIPDTTARDADVAAALADLAGATDATVVLAPFELETPTAWLERLRERLPAGRGCMLPPGLRPPEMAGVLGRCELVVALQRHGAILAAVGGTPALAVAPLEGAAAGDLEVAGLGLPPEAPSDLAGRLAWAWRRRAELRAAVPGAAANLASLAARWLASLADDLAPFADAPEPSLLAPLLGPALRGALKRARAASFERARIEREVTARLEARHLELAGEVEDRDRLVRELQFELHTKVGERDRLIRSLQDELFAKVGERDRLIQQLQAQLTEQRGDR
ncbi:MAG TPA: polysaccharide pyruvyl transferase family protein [Thermoanaerobaculaceae bacterium]|nr:polysaccharide pyruvyl transferase family protein [Thermoanaerobaculaceae bacterium]HRS16897.1 polysaccharide pyruvyl transferase family protein [Thermoanaerobaculaceae bacterium]